MKKLLTILVLIMLIISFFQITSMYALYKEKLQSEYATLLGAWKIKINEKDITATTGQVETFTIANNQLGYVNSEYIQAGKIAPNGEAYFDIVIDPSQTDVSIMYTIDIDTKGISSTNTDLELVDAIEFLRAENYLGQGEDGQTNKTTNETYEQNGNIYTSLIPVNMISQGYKNYIRLFFKWKNVTETVTETITEIVEIEGVETEVEKQVQKEVELNNEVDTIIGQTENSKLTIPIKINLKQYTGEKIGNESGETGEPGGETGESGESGE